MYLLEDLNSEYCGINNNESRKTAKILIKPTNPNSSQSLLDVNINVAKPEAVVALVKIMTFPIFLIIRISDLALLPCLLISS